MLLLLCDFFFLFSTSFHLLRQFTLTLVTLSPFARRPVQFTTAGSEAKLLFHWGFAECCHDGCQNNYHYSLVIFGTFILSAASTAHPRFNSTEELLHEDIKTMTFFPHPLSQDTSISAPYRVPLGMETVMFGCNKGWRQSFTAIRKSKRTLPEV